MKKFVKSGLAIMLSATLVFSGPVITGKGLDEVHAAEKYELIWSDEFEGNSLNRNNWNVEVNGYGGWNDELQYYCDSPENITVSDGTLKITALKKSYLEKEYTSARINSMDKAEFRFGKIEARMKLPSFKGAWPAFWMLGANGEMWPACGEIDIVETVNDESIVYGTAHWEKENTYDSSGSSTWAVNAQIDITQWHTYGIEWDEKKIVWYVDDIKYHVVDISEDPNRASLALDQYIILNLAVGGEWPGFEIDDNSLPATMEVDYVRAYKINENIKTSTVKNDSLETHQGAWESTLGSWAGVAGNVTTMETLKEGFTATLSAVGTDMWAAQTSLSNLSYVGGNSYTYRCTLTSDIDKNVFVKVEGDEHAELAADYISLKANQPYTYETTLFIPDTYTGNVSLFFAYGGGMNGEIIDASSAMNLNVTDVEFYTEIEVEEPSTEESGKEESSEEEPSGEPGTGEDSSEEISSEEPETEEDSSEEISSEEPETGEDSSEEISSEEPGTGEDSTEEISSEEPGTEEDSSEEISSEEPETEEDSSEEISSEEPGKGEDSTEEISSEEPGIEEDTTEEISSEEPGIEEDTTEEISSEEPGTEEDNTEEISSEEPGTEEDNTEEVSSEAPGTGEDSTEEISSEEPGTGEDSTEEISSEEPGTGEDSTEEVSSEEQGKENGATELPSTEETGKKDESVADSSTGETGKKEDIQTTPVPEGTGNQDENQNPGSNIPAAPQRNSPKLAKVRMKKVKRISQNRKAKITLKKVKNAKGYQVKYSTSAKFVKKKTKTVYTNRTNIVLKGLNANKKYYVKIRAYKIVNGKKQYGDWSSKKVIKVKK